MLLFYMYIIIVIVFIVVKRKSKEVKNIVIWNGIIILLVSLYFYVDYLFKLPCPPPPKPKNIANEVVWGGGCDGGNWFELVDIRNDTVRFRIYRRDYSYQDSSVAILSTDNNFVLCKACKNEMPFIRDSILHLVAFYNGNRIFINYPSPSGETRRCFLTEVGIPLDGTELEIYQYNQKLKKERLEKEAQ